MTLNNKSQIIRIISYSVVAITFAFLINNILTCWYDWPGIKKLYANYELFGFKKLNKPLDSSTIMFCYLQFLFYIISIVAVISYIFKTPEQNLNKDSEIFASLSAYIIRSAFWAVFILGVVDIIISFLAVERLLDVIFNEKGHENIFDVRNWYYAKMRLSLSGFKLIEKVVSQIIERTRISFNLD